jgi:NTP pyrophosphatase (non-canonical NTP hydrolase)
MSDIDILTKRLRRFAKDREWEKFHSPKNLAVSVCIEAGELLENFQWKDTQDRDIAPEIADVFIYLLVLADTMGIDLIAATRAKIDSNAIRYPIEKCKGSCKKADEL